MASFTQNLEEILKEQQDNKQRVESWIDELRLRWLRSLLFKINGVLHEYSHGLKIKAIITIKEYDCGKITLSEYSEINGIEHIRASALYMIGLRDDADSWGRLEEFPKVKIAFDGIVDAMNNYIEKYDPSYQCANKISELINQIGWGQIKNWRRLDLRKAKSNKKKLTNIKSYLGNGATIGLDTKNGKINEIIVSKDKTEKIDSPVVIGWFLETLYESKYRNRFFDETQGEDSLTTFSGGEIFDFLTATLKSVVIDFGAGDGQRQGTAKEMVAALTPLYTHLKYDLLVADADIQIITLFQLENVLKPTSFITYIEKSAKPKD